MFTFFSFSFSIGVTQFTEIPMATSLALCLALAVMLHQHNLKFSEAPVWRFSEMAKLPLLLSNVGLVASVLN